MAGLQQELRSIDLYALLYQDSVSQSIMRLKVDDLEQQMSDYKNRLQKIEQIIFFTSEDDAENRKILLTNDLRMEQRTSIAVGETDESWRDCRKITERAMEILSEWEEEEDIKIQVQYAAILVGKLMNLKKKDVIHSDDTRNKICTLLRNVIRLNASDEVFTKQQIAVLKKGFTFVTAEGVQKEDLLQLNRELRKKGLATMPAWE